MILDWSNVIYVSRGGRYQRCRSCRSAESVGCAVSVASCRSVVLVGRVGRVVSSLIIWAPAGCPSAYRWWFRHTRGQKSVQLTFRKKKNPEKSGKSVFWTPGTKIKFWIFWIFSKFLYMASISYINHHFRAPSPLKPSKSSLGNQNLLGVLLRDHSDHWGPLSDPIYLKGLTIKIRKKDK